jgi:hypothetical protein
MFSANIYYGNVLNNVIKKLKITNFSNPKSKLQHKREFRILK